MGDGIIYDVVIALTVISFLILVGYALIKILRGPHD